VIITTGSRLHAGFYYAGGGWGFNWGSMGFYVEPPRFRAVVEECSDPRIEGPTELVGVIEDALSTLGGDYCVDVQEYIPRHVGLGSTTQTVLGVACAVEYLRRGRCEPRSIARILGRAKVSGVGTLLFELGGFVADAGTPDPLGPRPLLRLEIPENWRFVIVIPELKRGLSEEAEELILRKPWKPSASVRELMALGGLRLAVSVARGDLEGALEGLRLIQSGTGLYFSKLQGGLYRRDLAVVAAEASKHGIYLAQSSWGPVLYTITTAEMAEGDARILRGILKVLGIRGEVVVSKPRNRGAEFKEG